MGFLDKIFTKETKLPELEPTSQIARKIDRFRPDLEHLAREVNDSLEVVPTDDTAYIFIGKPPKKFGIAWIRDGKINNFSTLARQGGVSEMKLQLISKKLRDAYERSEATRFRASIADQKITVTESQSLGRELGDIIQ